MIDHVSIGVTNVKRSKAFYDAVLEPLGMMPVMPVEIGGQLVGVDYGKPGLRSEYHPDYYGALVGDPNGNKIEACSYLHE